MYEYPFGNGQQLNLDWFLNEWKNLLAAWEAEKNGIEGALQAEIDRAEAALADVFAARDAAAQSAANALESKNAAAQSASDASGYLTTVRADANTASNAAQNAAQSESNAAESAQTALASKNTAANSERNAAQSEANANSSKNAAAQSAEDASASKDAAAKSAADADASKSAAAQSAEDAENAAASVEASAQQIATNTSDISNLKESIKNISGYGDNLFIAETATDGSRINATGGISLDANYFISDYIRVVSGATYEKNSPTIDAFHRICCYDLYKTPIVDSVSSENIYTTSQNAAYIRICGKLTEKDTTTIYLVSANDYIARNNPQVKNIIGQTGQIINYNQFTIGQEYTIAQYPRYIKKNDNLSFYAKINGAFSSIIIGKGLNSYRGNWITIGANNINFYHFESSPATLIHQVAHGQTIEDFIMVNLYHDKDGNLVVSLDTKTGRFVASYNIGFESFAGLPFVNLVINNPETPTTSATFSIQNGDMRKPLWIIGDSYLGVNNERVMGQLKNLGFWDGFLVNSLAGLNSANAFNELNFMLKYGTPKYLVWYLGMNDSDTEYQTTLENLINLCNLYGITLILNKVPTTPTNNKEAIAEIVENSDFRYIDSYLAVGTDANGEWYGGFISSDNVHPTDIGAEALAQRFIVDVPEVTMYGYSSVT